MSLKFLNKKGWHTQSMANQARLFEARAKETARKKAEEEREAELRQVFAPRRWCAVRTVADARGTDALLVSSVTVPLLFPLCSG